MVRALGRRCRRAAWSRSRDRPRGIEGGRAAGDRTGPTRSRPRRAFRDGGASSSSTPPTCRSSCSIAAIVSFAIGEWSTGALLLLLTVVNAVVGLRQEGKAESAMNALKSLTKQTARVRRGGVESSIPVEEVVLGDVVLITAGDNVAADGRIIQANSLDIDESALTGESTPASKTTDALADVRGGGRRPDEHGVHEHAGHARQRRHARDGQGRRRPGRQDRRDADRRPRRNRRR